MNSVSMLDIFTFKDGKYKQLNIDHQNLKPSFLPFDSAQYENVKKLIATINQTYNNQNSIHTIEPAHIRILHSIPNGSAIDVKINDQLTFKNVSYKQTSQYIQLNSGTNQIDLFLTSEPSTKISSFSFALLPNHYYTFAVSGLLDDIQTIQIVDNTYIPLNEAKIRFINLSPDGPSCDLAVIDGDVVFSNVSFLEASEFLSLTPMSVDLEIRIAGTKETVFSLRKSRIRSNQISNLVIVGSVNGNSRFEVISYN